MLSFARTLARRWTLNQNQTAAAAIAFYAIFLLAPTLFFAIAACGRVVGDASARASIERWLGGAVGPERAAQLLNAIDVTTGGHNWLVAALSAAILLLVASSAFVQVRLALHQIFRVEFKGLRDQLKSTLTGRVLAAAFAVVAGLLLVGLMIVTAWVGVSHVGWLTALTLPAASLTVVTALFAIVMLRLPKRSPPPRDVMIGAFVAAVLFEIGRFLMTWYLARSVFAAAYGASGALVAVLIWTYYSAQIFLLGAEIAQLRSERRGARAQ